LRITVGAVAETRLQAIFQAVHPNEKPREIARCRLEELGLPQAPGELQRTPEQAFGVPEKVLNLLKSAAGELGPSPLPPQEALWLDLRGPRGYLYVLPWERMLEPLGRPLLRRPQHALRPTASESALSVGLCASAPESASRFETVPVLRRLCRIWTERPERRVKIHVFTDSTGVAGIREWAAGREANIVVHDPPKAGPTKASVDSAALAHPWLRWIRDATQGTALDVVHFAGHGHLDQDRGQIALADTPRPSSDQITRFAGAPEVLSLMGQVGAWCLALTGPQDNHCPAGLRELADAVSLAGPYVAVVHEMNCDDTEMRQLGDTVATIAGDVPPGLGPLPAVTCWVHPQFIRFPRTDEQKQYLDHQGNSSFIDDTTREVIARDDTPAWVASATRTVESLQAKWVPRDPGQAMDSDAMQALESVASLVRKHVEKST
jgi:hypothetical protein